MKVGVRYLKLFFKIILYQKLFYIPLLNIMDTCYFIIIYYFTSDTFIISVMNNVLCNYWFKYSYIWVIMIWFVWLVRFCNNRFHIILLFQSSHIFLLLSSIATTLFFPFLILISSFQVLFHFLKSLFHFKPPTNANYINSECPFTDVHTFPNVHALLFLFHITFYLVFY